MGTKSERTFRRDLGRRVKTLRLARGLSQRELAELADIADKYLSRVEVGAVTPSMLVGTRLARALGVPLDALIATTPARTPDPRWTKILRKLRRLEAKHELERAAAILDILAQ